MGDQDIRTAFAKARRCIARISFCREKLEEDYKYMVIPGIIVSVENRVARIVCNPEFFKDCPSFSVTFPTAGGYDEEQTVPSNSVDNLGKFVTFALQLTNAALVQPAKFETRALKSGDFVDALTFPRKSFITPAAYSEGRIVYGPDGTDKIEVSFQECALHEYGFLGSPLFNRNGDLVGITYADMGTLIAYNVLKIRNVVHKYLNGISYVLDGHAT